MEQQNPHDLQKLQVQLASLTSEEGLAWVSDHFQGSVAFSTSFGLEDQVITHLICEAKLPIRIFTLDTGRLFSETYGTWRRTLEKYGLTIQACYPDQHKLEDFITAHGPDAFYESVDKRKQCCHLRKVEPLHRALQGVQVWVTGIRADQSPERQHTPILEWDEHYQLFKYHPLLNWTYDQLTNYVSQHDIPVNPLHAKGFVSIGCAPCTRAIRPGDDFRAGRWWWEDDSKKECGLHWHEAEAEKN